MISKYQQTWSQQRKVCRPAKPLRLGDGFRYHPSSSHDNATLFRKRMQQRTREAGNV